MAHERLSWRDVDESGPDTQVVTIPLTDARATPELYFEFSPMSTAFGFVVLAGPTTGTLKLHLKKRQASGIDLTTIGKYPGIFNKCYIENSSSATALTLIFMLSELLLPTLAPSPR